MKKLLLLLPLLVACSDDKSRQIVQQQQQIQQLQAQQNYQQPVIQAPIQPATPIIINQQPAQSHSAGDTITNMAVGALAAHAITNALSDNSPRDTHTIIKEKTVYVDRPTTVQPTMVVTPQPVNVAPPVTVVNKPAMDMNKLSESAKQQFTQPVNTSTQLPAKSTMDMSKLSNPKPVSLAKPVNTPVVSKMNMSKLSRK